ncbi:MAG: DUF4249 domain-containing protein [Bacteroidales bacterium]|nr:DUF4249 domain-containing protein [Bacteroidales bacterium]
MSRLKYFILIIVFFAFSCEKEIDVQLEDSKPKLVVEGVIENGEYAYVSLSKSAPYFTPVDSTTFQNMFITEALVIVSDGIESDTLTFDTVPLFPPLRFQGHKLKGQLNTSYTLRIEYEGEVYTADTKILDAIPIDSVRYQYEYNSDSLGYIWFYANDPVNQNNYYRVFTMDVDIDFSKEIPVWVHPAGSVTDDSYFNGKLVESQMYRGRNPMLSEAYYEAHPDDWWAFKMGDKVLVKLTQIDYESFIFWRTMEQVLMTGDNPFAAPTTVQTNISNNALGSWCGYASTVQYIEITEDIIIP